MLQPERTAMPVSARPAPGTPLRRPAAIAAVLLAAACLLVAASYWALAAEHGDAPAQPVVAGASGTAPLAAWLAGLVSLVSLVSLAAACVVTVRVRSRAHRLIDALLRGTQALQSGSLAHRIEIVGGNGDLGRAATAFNAMAAELQQHRQAAERRQVELEEAVEARTRELRAAHATLQGIDARRRQFLGDISHELRTPATAIRGEAEIALRGADKSVRDYQLALQRIVAIVQQLGLLIDDVLLLARVEADPNLLRRVALPWLDALREAADLATTIGHEQQVAVRLEPGDPARGGALLAHADPDRLRQALMIALDNAVRYSRPHGVVTLGCEANESMLTAVVRDEGIGIDADELPKLFVRHARGVRARAHRADGSGLGLAIAQSIVQTHGGRISIESESGRGTTVRLSVPRWHGAGGETA